MIAIPVLAAMIVVPGVSLMKPVQLLVGEGYVAMDSGEGKTPAIGQRVTAEFTLIDGLGRVLADSQQRGLQFTYPYGSIDADPLLTAAAEGISLDQQRTVLFSSDFLSQGIGGIVPPRTSLLLKLKLSRSPL